MNRPFLIQIKNISKTYATKDSPIQTKALNNISLDIEEGDFVAIAGPSGSGKTTLLNIIGGLDRPSAGDVLIGNTSLASLTPARNTEFRLNKIGFIFAASNLISTLNAAENAEYVALLQGVSHKHRRHEVFHTLKDLGLTDLINLMPSELSACQQQKVALARAILAKPKLILADEPASNLDSKTGDELIGLMKTMSQTLNITFIIATHDTMITEKAKTIINLRDGNI
jgi:putative ABC transport system ATP-binding protein